MKLITQALVIRSIRKDMPPPQRAFRKKNIYSRKGYNPKREAYRDE